MKGIVPEFKKVHRSLCEELEIEEDLDWINKIINMVV